MINGYICTKTQTFIWAVLHQGDQLMGLIWTRITFTCASLLPPARKNQPVNGTFK